VSVLGVHAGASGVTAVVVADGSVSGRHHAAYDGDGPEAIWRATLAACGSLAAPTSGIGVTSPPGSTVVWDRETLSAHLASPADREPHAWRLLEEGQYAVGPVASYLVARMSRGTYAVTDALDPDVPPAARPDVVPRSGVLARTDPRSFLGLDLPVTGLASDDRDALAAADLALS
jgi:glycerol kinase